MSEYRRRRCGALKDAEWFDPNNVEARQAREECNRAAIADMVEFLNGQANGIVILDSTNPTHERRKNLVKIVRIKCTSNASRITVIYFFADECCTSEGDVRRSDQRQRGVPAGAVPHHCLYIPRLRRNRWQRGGG